MAEVTTDGTATEVTTVDQLPEFAQNMIKELREEAAKHRTSKGEAVEAAKAELTESLTTDFEAKLAEAKAAVETQAAETSKYQLELAKLRTALGARVEETVFNQIDIFANRLRGETEEDLTKDAAELKTLMGPGWAASTEQTKTPPATDPSPEGKPLALNDDDGLQGALMRAVGISN